MYRPQIEKREDGYFVIIDENDKKVEKGPFKGCQGGADVSQTNLKLDMLGYYVVENPNGKYAVLDFQGNMSEEYAYIDSLGFLAAGTFIVSTVGPNGPFRLRLSDGTLGRETFESNNGHFINWEYGNSSRKGGCLVMKNGKRMYLDVFGNLKEGMSEQDVLFNEIFFNSSKSILDVDNPNPEVLFANEKVQKLCKDSKWGPIVEKQFRHLREGAIWDLFIKRNGILSAAEEEEIINGNAKLHKVFHENAKSAMARLGVCEIDEESSL